MVKTNVVDFGSIVRNISNNMTDIYIVIAWAVMIFITGLATLKEFKFSDILTIHLLMGILTLGGSLIIFAEVFFEGNFKWSKRTAAQMVEITTASVGLLSAFSLFTGYIPFIQIFTGHILFFLFAFMFFEAITPM